MVVSIEAGIVRSIGDLALDASQLKGYTVSAVFSLGC